MASPNRFVLAVHGGAGVLSREVGRDDDAFRRGLGRALAAGRAVLAEGGAALDAVAEAVRVLEDDPLFNAGRGSVLTENARHEMDAAIMDGASRRLGAVAGLWGPRNPVRAARTVMEHSRHVMFIGEGAHAFCRAHGLEWMPREWFTTPSRRGELENVLAARPGPEAPGKHGTVGAVALDRNGHLAAATSTGGMVGKAAGRVGDAPLAGAGTWADAACAVSCTGHGELFIRAAAAHEISARLRLGHQDLAAACADVLSGLGERAGGLIAVDADGHWTLPFTTEGMFRGVVTDAEPAAVAIYGGPLSPVS